MTPLKADEVATLMRGWRVEIEVCPPGALWAAVDRVEAGAPLEPGDETLLVLWVMAGDDLR